MNKKVQKLKACVNCKHCQERWISIQRFGGHQDRNYHACRRPYYNVVLGELKTTDAPCRVERYSNDPHRCGMGARFFKRGKWRPG